MWLEGSTQGSWCTTLFPSSLSPVSLLSFQTKRAVGLDRYLEGMPGVWHLLFSFSIPLFVLSVPVLCFSIKLLLDLMLCWTGCTCCNLLSFNSKEVSHTWRKLSYLLAFPFISMEVAQLAGAGPPKVWRHLGFSFFYEINIQENSLNSGLLYGSVQCKTKEKKYEFSKQAEVEEN